MFKIKLVQGLCVSVAMLLMAGNAMGAAGVALEEIKGRAQAALVTDQHDQSLLLVIRAVEAILADDPANVSDDRMRQNTIIKDYANRLMQLYHNKRSKEQGEFPGPATLAIFQEQQVAEMADLRELLAHRVQ